MTDGPEDERLPEQMRFRVGDRVRLLDKVGTVKDAWWTPRGYETPGQEQVRLELDNGITVTCQASKLRPA